MEILMYNKASYFHAFLYGTWLKPNVHKTSPSRYTMNTESTLSRRCVPIGVTICSYTSFKGRFLEFQRYHNFANLLSKLSENTFYKEINKFR